MSDEFIFGYGSLVNAATHDYDRALPAELRGWRREWHYTTLRDIAYLSAIPDPNGSISGVVLKAPPADAALEQREQAYFRAEVSAQISYDGPGATDINVFAISPSVHCPRNAASTLLLSYIDVIVQGYYRQAGEAGVKQFFETTHGWGAPAINDRAAPVYPRHQPLDRHETALTDHWLDVLSARVE